MSIWHKKEKSPIKELLTDLEKQRNQAEKLESEWYQEMKKQEEIIEKLQTQINAIKKTL